jgi:AcrR family transcriptional regulator
MTELRLIAPETEEGPFSAGTLLPRRLPPGRHGIPTNLVAEHQRLRLLAAMAEALGAHGYANVTTTHVSELANVSTSTFYKHFGNLWDCALAAYVSAADRLCAEIEAACTSHDPLEDPLAGGIDAALTFFATAPAEAQLLSLQAPYEASAIVAARRILVSRLAAMLRRGQATYDTPPRQPHGLDERMVDATLVFVGARISSGGAASLAELGPELTAILDRPRQVA